MYLLIQSVVIYTLFAFLLNRNANKVTYRQINLSIQSSKWYSLPKGYWVCIVIFMIVSGLRYKVGVDHFSYLNDYLSALEGTFEIRDSGIELGYIFITKVFAALHIHPVFFFAALAFLQIFFVLQAMKKERDVVPYMMSVMVLGTFYMSWMNGIRQMIVACSFMWATQFIVKRNFKKYLFWILFAYLWHVSSVILVMPFLFAYSTFIWNKRWINIAIFIACFVLGNNPTWINIMTALEGFLTFLGYNNYAEQLLDLADASNLQSFSFGPRMLMMMISYISVIIFYPKVRLAFNDSNIDLYFKLFFIGVCGYYLMVNTTIVFQRPVQYFDIFALPMIAYTLFYLKQKNIFLFFILSVASMSFVYLQCYDDFQLPVALQHATLYQFYPLFD